MAHEDYCKVCKKETSFMHLVCLWCPGDATYLTCVNCNNTVVKHKGRTIANPCQNPKEHG